MSALKQLTSISAMNLRAIPQRVGTSLVIVIGIAGVVAVLLSVLAMATGIMQTIARTGRADRAIVLRGGSTAEIASTLSRDQAMTISDAPGVKHSADGKPLASAESLTLVDLPTENGQSWANATVRGVGPAVLAVRPEMKIVQGRMFKPAVHEFIVGSKAHSQFPTLALGKRVKFANGDWEVVGIFESGGDRHESEIFGDSETMMSAIGRNGYQPVTVQLESEASFDAFKTALTTNPTLNVDVKRESDFFAEESKPITKVLSIVAYVVGGIMAVGALFGALNTMYSAVSARTKEIATLRALGFGATSVVVSVFAEALALSLIGGLLGCLAAWLFFDGHVVSTSASGGISQLVFALTLTPALAVLGILWACAIGLIGGLFPALRAARLPVATALRAV
ncbi:MAG TPA: ABC transporter permease [Steroidobacteraceae bacterium]|jgi:putative ABC transport system permease protein|nr:ABC transporter permease [Steroidobacteraceae bacterium]